MQIEPASRNERHAAGRSALRRAAAAIGVDLGPVGRDFERGAPLLPTGLLGSISHTRGISMAVVARATAARSIGVDVERCTPERPGVEGRVLTPLEKDRLLGLSGPARWRAVLSLFCAKEGAFKALDSVVAGPPLTFKSLEVDVTTAPIFVVRVLAAPAITALVTIAQDDALTVAIATT